MQGRLSSPLGSAPVGYLMYTRDGYVSVLIAASKPDPLVMNKAMKTGLKEARTMEECAYSGTYELGLDHVIHNVHASLPSGLAGQSLKQFMQHEGDRLLQHVPPALLCGGLQSGMFVWERVRRRTYPKIVMSGHDLFPK